MVLIACNSGENDSSGADPPSALNSGILDATFNGTGFIIENISGKGFAYQGFSVAVDNLGRILVSGASASASGTSGLIVWRFNAAGTPDSSFNGGFITAPAPTNAGDSAGNALTTDQETRILVAGFSSNGLGSSSVAVWRFNPDGTPDTSFNRTGSVIQSHGTNDIGLAIARDLNNRILVTGSSEDSSGFSEMIIWRFNTDGTPDTSFNGTGLVAIRNATGANSSDMGVSITVDGSNRILVTGSGQDSSGNTVMAIWRFNPDGTPDTSFHGTGLAAVRNALGNNSSDAGTSIAVDGSGRILVTGSSQDLSGNTALLVRRFNSDGTPDTSFHGTGLAIHQSAFGTNSSDSGKSISVDGNGRILITGSSRNLSGNTAMIVWRLNSDGTPDTNFNGTGLAVFELAAQQTNINIGQSIALDTAGRILVAGTSGQFMAVWRFVP
jgi:uncharacterized delta-60 repeat protein